jgi:hypothetical protein
VEPFATLEALLRRSIRDAVHEKVRGVPDVPLSEASDPSCVRKGPMIAAGTARDCEFKSTVAIRRCSEKIDPEVAPHAAEKTRLP